jgi:ParB/RepB/Spo0J family partition protein
MICSSLQKFRNKCLFEIFNEKCNLSKELDPNNSKPYSMGDSMFDTLMTVVFLPIDRIRPMAGQPRKYFNPHKLRKLAASMKKAGQKLPVIVHPVEKDSEHDYELVDGERRWRSRKLAGEKRIAAIVLNGDDLEEFFEVSAIANFGREDHTPLEIANSLQRVRTRRIRIDGSCTEQDLAEMFAQTVTWVSHHLLLLKLSPEVQEMMSPEIPKRKRLTRSAAVQISRLPPSDQAKFARQVLRDRKNMSQIRIEIRDELIKRKVHDGPVVFRGRPVNRYQSFCNLLRNFKNGSDVFLIIPRTELETALNNRSNRELEELRKLVQNCQDHVGKFSAILNKVMEPSVKIVG